MQAPSHRGTPSLDQEPSLLGLDCEMCVTEDDDKALLSLCVVDPDGERVMHVGLSAITPPHRYAF